MRIALFALLLCLLLYLMSAALPYYWGNAGYAAKMEFLSKKRGSFNVFFFGSSRIYRQVMPDVFDAETTHKTHSFNLAYRATFNPESYYLLENFIKKKAAQPTHILIELQPFVQIADRNLHTVRSNYFLNYSYFLLVKNEYDNQRKNAAYSSDTSKVSDESIRRNLNKNSSDTSKVSDEWAANQLKNLHLSFLDNVLKHNHSREMLLSLLGQGKRDNHALGEAKDGFVALDKSAIYQKGLVKRHTEFLEEYDSTQSCFEAEMASYQIALRDTLEDNTPHLQKINQLIETAARQNYTLIFVLVPKRSELLPLFQQIPKKHRINLANPQEFPHFYHNKYWFDKKHFNERGAEIFTRELAKKYIEKYVRKK